jgi:hypothetical protein
VAAAIAWIIRMRRRYRGSHTAARRTAARRAPAASTFRGAGLLFGVVDWIGSLRLEQRGQARLVLSLSRGTHLLGAGMIAVGALAAARLWSTSALAVVVAAVLAAAGAVLASLERRLTFDRDAGVLELEQRTFGIGNRTTVPLFHLRAVVVVARQTPGRAAVAKYVAYLERRVGRPIYLDEARTCARLMKLAEAIAEVAELRLEYEAVPPPSVSREA